MCVCVCVCVCVSQVQLPALTPVTADEKREFLLAAERRTMRYIYFPLLISVCVCGCVVWVVYISACCRTTYAKDIQRLVKNIHKEKKRTSKIKHTPFFSYIK